MALPNSIRIKDFEEVKPPVISNYREIKNEIKLPDGLSRCWWKTMRGTYNVCRISVCGFCYYLMPYLSVWLPYMMAKTIEIGE